MTDVFLLCFSVMSRSSFENLTVKWVPEVTHFCPGVPLVLVGNKSDLRENREALAHLAERHTTPVAVAEATALARAIGAVSYVENSALHGHSVKEVFETAVRAALSKSSKPKGKSASKRTAKHSRAVSGPVLPEPPELPKGIPAPWINIVTSTFGDELRRALQGASADICDVVFRFASAPGETLRAHMAVLCCASQLFRSLFLDQREKWAHRSSLLDASAASAAAAPAAPQEPKKEAPPEFYDPITLQMMVDPVIAVDGYTYERRSITQWLSSHDTSPMTTSVLESRTLIANHNLRSQIASFLEKAPAEGYSLVARQQPGSVAPPDDQHFDYGCEGFVDIRVRKGESAGECVEVTVAPRVSSAVFAAVLEFLYAGSIQRMPSADDSAGLSALEEAARLFDVPYLEQACRNVAEGNEFLNPSIGTYLNDELGKRARDLLLGREHFADVRLRVAGAEVPAHKVFLTCRCDVLSATLSGKFSEARSGVVEIGDASQAEFMALLEYLYTDHSPIEDVERMELLALAHRHNQPRLLSLCELYISKAVEAATQESVSKSQLDVCGILEPAQLLGASQLEKFVMHFLCTNFEPMSARPEFDKLSRENREKIEENQWPPKAYMRQLDEYEAEYERITGKPAPNAKAKAKPTDEASASAARNSNTRGKDCAVM